MAQFYKYPAVQVTSSSPSVGLTGAVAPTSADEVGFVDGNGKLQPFSGTSASSGPNVTVSNFPATQPVSGTVTANQGTAGASAWKVDGSAVTQPVSGSVSVSNFPATQPVSGSVSVSNFPATQPISAVSLPLPTGASTSALQTTGNTSLSSIDGKTPALGQALAAASVPVVLTALQITALTPPTIVGTKSPVNINGSYSEITNLTTTAQTFTVPANAVGFVMETDSIVNTVAVRWKIGAVATVSSGMVLEPGRDTGYIPCSTNISVIAVSGSAQSVAVQWILSA